MVRPHLISMLNGPFTVPRSHEWDARTENQPNKDNVAAYIWHKFGLYCTINGVQKFMPLSDAVSCTVGGIYTEYIFCEKVSFVIIQFQSYF